MTLTVEQVPVGSLSFYPGNAKRHDLAAIAQSLTENGLYRPVVTQKSTGYVLCGNGTLEAARNLGWTEIDAVFIDCDDIRAKKINLADNRIPELGGGYDVDALAALLTSVDDLTGSGYSLDDLARMRAPLPPGFPLLDPDAAPAPAKMVECPECGHEFVP